MTSEYNKYLELDALLRLQNPRVSPPDINESLFLVSHQIAELWCKQILSELRQLNSLLARHDVSAGAFTVNRCNRIFESLQSVFEVLATLTPEQFAAFRPLLHNASGAQSLQFHSLDILLGIRNRGILRFFPEGTDDYSAIMALFSEPSVVETVERFLRENQSRHTQATQDRPGLATSAYLKDRTTQTIEVSPSGIDRLVSELRDLDRRYQRWHLTHFDIAAKLIGQLPGTGGTEGARYLRQKIDRTLFPFLWGKVELIEGVHAH